MARKLLSIIIPVYNRLALLEKAINSIPDEENLEIVIINDASTDDNIQVYLSRLQNYRINIKYLKMKKI